MIPKQVIHEISPPALKDKVAVYKKDGWRLVQICSTTLDVYELSYSFTREQQFEHLRIKLPLDHPAIASITEHYFGAFAYENELHDLFGISFDGLKLDYQGNFFKMSVKKPFSAGSCAITSGGKPHG